MLTDGGLNPSPQHSSRAVPWEHPPHPALPVLALQQKRPRPRQPHLRPLKITHQPDFGNNWDFTPSLMLFDISSKLLGDSGWDLRGEDNINVSHPWSLLPHQATPSRLVAEQGIREDVGDSQPCQCHRESRGAGIGVAAQGAAVVFWQVGCRETTAVLLFPPCSALVEEMLRMWVKLTQKADKSAFIHWF